MKSDTKEEIKRRENGKFKPFEKDQFPLHTIQIMIIYQTDQLLLFHHQQICV
jgi:hypothetical protein